MQEPKSYYQEQGYYIFRKLIPDKLIDNLLEEYNSKILVSQDYFFRQSSNRWKKNKISTYGYCKESFLNVHDYPNYPSVSKAALNIFCSPEVREALTRITGSQEHNLMQSMLFDMNTATPPHQDCYYLDSLPYGYLLAGWFALEDIQKEAGRFYVLPKSHLIDFEITDEEKIAKANPSYVQKIKNYLGNYTDDIYYPALQKGDVLFWNSRTIHGSAKTLNPKYSRKSLTAHYLPSQYQFGSRRSASPQAVDYSSSAGMKYKITISGKKYYSLSAKLRTDLYRYISQSPKLMRAAKFVYNPVKRLLK